MQGKSEKLDPSALTLKQFHASFDELKRMLLAAREAASGPLENAIKDKIDDIIKDITHSDTALTTLESNGLGQDLRICILTFLDREIVSLSQLYDPNWRLEVFSKKNEWIVQIQQEADRLFRELAYQRTTKGLSSEEETTKEIRSIISMRDTLKDFYQDLYEEIKVVDSKASAHKQSSENQLHDEQRKLRLETVGSMFTAAIELNKDPKSNEQREKLYKHYSDLRSQPAFKNNIMSSLPIFSLFSKQFDENKHMNALENNAYLKDIIKEQEQRTHKSEMKQPLI